MTTRSPTPFGFGLLISSYVLIGLLDRLIAPGELIPGIPLLLASSLGMALVLAKKPKSLRAVWIGAMILTLSLEYRQDSDILTLFAATVIVAIAAYAQCLIAASIPKRLFKTDYAALNNVASIFVFITLALPLACLLPSAAHEIFWGRSTQIVSLSNLMQALSISSFISTWLSYCFSTTLFAPLFLALLLKQQPEWQDRWVGACLLLAIVVAIRHVIILPNDTIPIAAFRLVMLMIAQSIILFYTGRNAQFKLKARTGVNEQLNLFRRVIDSSNDMIMICEEDQTADNRLKTIYVNDMFVTRSGFLRSEVLGKPPELLIGKQTPRRTINSVKRAMLARSTFRAELATHTKDGGTNWDEVIVRPVILSHESPISWIFVLRDASKRKELEDSMRNAVDTANENTRAKSNFISTMSHEIRTPMHGIIGLVELALLEDLPVAARGLLVTAQTASQTLLTILNDILLFSKIEENKLFDDVARLDLDRLLEEIKNLFFASASLKGIGLELRLSKNCPQWLIGDATKIRQILSNLVGNAIKFTSKGAVQITIDLMSFDDTTVTIRFSVVDTGIGLDPATLEYVLQPFHQASTDTWTKYGGSGLGLTICQRLLNLMNSELKLKKTLTGGAHFYFDLSLGISAERVTDENQDRLAPEEERRTAGRLSDSTALPLSDIRILLAEDNPINQEIAVKFLERAGASVDVAQHGLEVLSMIEQTNYDVILMDLQMPHMDGLTATRELFMQPAWNKCPIIGVSAGLSNQDKDKCISAGMRDFLLKPVNWQQLISLLREVVKPSLKFGGTKFPVPSSNHSVPLAASSSDDTVHSIEATIKNLDDNQLALRLLGLFSVDSIAVKKELETLISVNDFEQALKKLHYLKGSVSILGMQDLLSAIDKLHTSLQHSTLDQSIYDMFKQQLESAINIVNKLRTSLESNLKND